MQRQIRLYYKLLALTLLRGGRPWQEHWKCPQSITENHKQDSQGSHKDEAGKVVDWKNEKNFDGVRVAHA